MQLRDSIPANKQLLLTQQQDLDVWVNALNGGLKLVQEMNRVRELTQQMNGLDKNSDEYKTKVI